MKISFQSLKLHRASLALAGMKSYNRTLRL